MKIIVFQVHVFILTQKEYLERIFADKKMLGEPWIDIDNDLKNLVAQGYTMKRLTVFLLTLLLMSSATLAVGADPCKTHSLDFGVNTVGWEHVPLSKLKRDTVYSLTQADGQMVLRGNAEGSASLYVSRMQAAMEVPKTISWKWKTDALVPGADNRIKNKEDAPLRVMVAFDGDHATLPEIEKKRFKRAKSLSGRDLPYALLMYIWSDHVPVGTVIPSAHTSQVKMLVVASGVEGLGQWQTVKRNLADDYRQAFGAKPGAIIGVGVMTDSDNTRTKATGEYHDISLECSEKGAN